MMSHAPTDKLQTCLNHAWTKSDCDLAREYFDACRRGWNLLSPADRELAIAVISTYSDNRIAAAEGMAARLPPAPKCPFDE
jgi:hypothetical protein